MNAVLQNGADDAPPPLTLDTMRRMECDNGRRMFEAFLRAGLSHKDAATLERAQKRIYAAFALLSLLRSNSNLSDAESPESGSAALDAFLRGGVEEAASLLVDDVYNALCSVGEEV